MDAQLPKKELEPVRQVLRDLELQEFYVIPNSARKLNVEPDKEGNTLWRVVVFKDAKEQFSRKCRERKVAVRDFTFCSGAIEQLNKARADCELKMTSTLWTWRGG